MTVRIWSHNPGSSSATTLSDALHARVLSAPDRTTWRPRRGDVVVNWGNSQFNGRLRGIDLGGIRLLNHPDQVRRWSDKRIAFSQVAGSIAAVPNTRSEDVARGWLDRSLTVVARHKLRGSSGEGIRIVETGDDLPRAPLYTCYVRKTDEYRLHFIRTGTGTQYMWQKKLRRLDMDAPNWKIRNYENGFIFSPCRSNEDKPVGWGRFQEQVNTICQLDYGAVDVLYATRSSNPSWVNENGRLQFLELNTAPGIASPTLHQFYNRYLGDRVRYEQQQ